MINPQFSIASHNIRKSIESIHNRTMSYLLPDAFKSPRIEMISKKKTYISPNKTKIINTDLLKQKQVENLNFENKKSDMKRETASKRLEVNHILSVASIEFINKNRIRMITEEENKQAFLIRQGAINGIGKELKSECINANIIENPSDIKKYMNNSLSLKNYDKFIKNDQDQRFHDERYIGLRKNFTKHIFLRKLGEIKQIETNANKAFKKASSSINKYKT